jgi:hypothetical protein
MSFSGPTRTGVLLRSTARGALYGAVIGMFGSVFVAMFFLNTLHNIPNFLWNVFPQAVWSGANALLLTILASAVYVVPLSAMFGALIRFLITASRKTVVHETR